MTTTACSIVYVAERPAVTNNPLVGRIGSGVRLIASLHIDLVYFAILGENFHIMAPLCDGGPKSTVLRHCYKYTLRAGWFTL